MKTTNDQSIFAWKLDDDIPRPLFYRKNGPLALSPLAFRSSFAIAQFQIPQSELPLPVSVEGGVRIDVLVKDIKGWVEYRECFAILHCEIGTVPGVLADIKLCKYHSNAMEVYSRSEDTRIFMFESSTSEHDQGFPSSSRLDQVNKQLTQTVTADHGK
jgi:hypothetical protein